MDWSCGMNGRKKSGKENRCPESGGENEVRKTEIAMGDYIKQISKEWEKIEKKSNR